MRMYLQLLFRHQQREESYFRDFSLQKRQVNVQIVEKKKWMTSIFKIRLKIKKIGTFEKLEIE